MGNIKSFMSKSSFCEFCEVISTSRELLIFDEDGIIAFHDIDKSSALEHLLVCPKTHIPDTSALTLEDIPLVQKMHEVGEKLLQKLRPNTPYRFGYHCPPINSVNHLHMHAFALPIKDKTKNLIIYGYMLTPPEKVIQKIKDRTKIKELKSD